MFQKNFEEKKRKKQRKKERANKTNKQRIMASEPEKKGIGRQNF